MASNGKVAIVTGASRGIGKGIALQLGEAGATVYITGRTKSKSHSARGSLEDTAREVESRGGKCIPVACDHSSDADIDALFEQVNREQNGQLDILVNNAFSAIDAVMDAQSEGKSFWELPPTLWDEVNNVGLRNHYICAVKAAQTMTSRKAGLIVNISAMGGIMYMFTPAFGIGKAGMDRMAADCAKELKKYNVTFVSLWPGPVKTGTTEERILKSAKEKGAHGHSSESRERQQDSAVTKDIEIMHRAMANGETIEFAGKCVVALAQDPRLINRTGQIILSEDLAEEFNLLDVDGRQHYSPRSIKNGLLLMGWTKTADYVPSWIKIPRSMMNLAFGRL